MELLLCPFHSSWGLCAHTRQTYLSNLLTDNKDDDDINSVDINPIQLIL